MSSKTSLQALSALGLLALVSATGCQWSTFGPSLNAGPLFFPIPVTPFLQDQLEDNAWDKERYSRVPILPPLMAGGPEKSMDPPSEDEVMRALEKARSLEGGIPFLHEIQRNNVRIVVEPISDYIDPPRMFPLIGMAQVHHANYKCIVYFSEVTWVGWPIPHKITDEDAQEVIYIDHSHLHMVGNVDGGPGANY